MNWASLERLSVVSSCPVEADEARRPEESGDHANDPRSGLQEGGPDAVAGGEELLDGTRWRGGSSEADGGSRVVRVVVRVRHGSDLLKEH
jgi:hypothetical protein